MSQSDYIKYKKVSSKLKMNALLPVLTSQEYTDYKQYTIQNTVINTETLTNNSVADGYILIFNKQRKVSSCPTFGLCTGTNQRNNRKLVTTFYYDETLGPYTKPVTEYVKHPTWEKTGCKCILNSVNTDDNICSCKKSH
jgi:hypothetical protein